MKDNDPMPRNPLRSFLGVWLLGVSVCIGPLGKPLYGDPQGEASTEAEADNAEADNAEADNAEADNAEADNAEAEVDQLIDQLGAASFRQRAAAGNRLLQLGPAAIEAVQRGRQADDPEIRRRCQLLLVVLVRADRQRRLDLFAELAHESSSDTVDQQAQQLQLPGWDRFAQQVGHAPDARELFRAILQAHWDLVQQATEDPQRATTLLEERFEQNQQGPGSALRDPAVSAAAFFFVSLLPERMTDSVSQQIYILVAFRPEFSRFANSQRGQAARRLLDTWIRRSQGGVNNNFHALTLAERFDLPEAGAVRARRALQGQPMQQLTVRALEILTHYGDPSDAQLAMMWLDDNRSVRTDSIEYPARPGPASGVPAGDPGLPNRLVLEVRVCDLALFAAVVLKGEDPRVFGFEHLPDGPARRYASSHVGFASDQQRQTAIAQWRQALERP